MSFIGKWLRVAGMAALGLVGPVTISAQSTKVDLQTQVKNILSLANGGTGSGTASGARTNLGVPAATGGTLTNPNLIIAGCIDGYAVYVSNALTGSLGCLPFTSGAPSTAKYILQTADAGLPNAQVLGSLVTGLVKVTSTTGVLSTAVAADLPAHASRHQNGGDDEVATATPGANAIVKAGAGGTIAAGWIPATGVSANTYGSTSTIPTFTVATDGRLTFAGAVTPALPSTAITSGVIDPARLITGGATNLRCLHVNASGQIEVTAADCNTSGTGDVLGPATNSDAYVPIWNGANSKTLANGYCVSQSGAVDCIPRLTGTSLNIAGGVVAGALNTGGVGTTSKLSQTGSATQLEVWRPTAFTTNIIVKFTDELGAELSRIDGNGNFTGRASTASGLSLSPALCSAGNLIHTGVDTQGNAQGCGKVQLTSEVAGVLPINGGGTGKSSWLANRCVTTDGSGNLTESAGACGSGGGGVTSVGLSLPSEFTVSGSPVTSSGTLTGVWANTSQNYVFSGPSGSGGVPGFRLLVAGDIPNLDAGKVTSGTLPVARGGTGSTSYTANQCIAANSGGTALVSAGGTCITGPGVSDNGYLVTWSGNGGSALGSTRYEARSTVPAWPIANATAVLRDGTNGGSGIRDNGEQFYNVKAFGARGDGSTNDRAAIQSAIDSVPGTGGLVFFPAGDYVISTEHPSYSGCGIVIGNGTGSAYSSVNNITLAGVGFGASSGESGNANAQRGATRVRLGGSVTKLVCLVGPMFGGGIRDMFLDGNNNSTSTAIDWRHTSHFTVERVRAIKFTSYGFNMYGMDRDASQHVAFNNCWGKIKSVDMLQGGANFLPILMTGAYDSDDTTNLYHSTCSTTVDDSGLDAGSSMTYAIQLGYADNNRFNNLTLTCGGAANCSAGGINLDKKSDAGPYSNLFPYANKTNNVVTTTQFGGTSGTGTNSAINIPVAEGDLEPTTASTYSLTDDMRLRAYAVGALPTNCSSTANRSYAGISGSGEIYSFGRGADSTNGFQLCTEADVLMSAVKGTKPSRGSTLTEITAFSPQPANGTIVYCSDCTQGTSTCTGSGSGTMAFRLNGAWKCF